MGAGNRREFLARLGCAAIVAALGLAPGVARPADGWRKEFEDLCSRTQDAMVLKDDELRSLVERCDRLKPALDALSEPERKAYSRRLAACRNLYAYVLESRQAR
jgi:hypothetical protein